MILWKKILIVKSKISWQEKKIFKKMIMTFNYSATLYRNIDDTLTEIRKHPLFVKCSENEQKIIIENAIEEIKNFYHYLKNSYEEELFFNNKSSILVEYWDPLHKHIITYDNQEIPLNYYQLDKKRLSVLNKEKERKTFSFYETNNIYDSKKTLQALRANIIHSSDAQLTRLILKSYKIYGIHDSFGIDIFNICKFINDVKILIKIDLIKTEFKTIEKKTIYNDIYSIFILL